MKKPKKLYSWFSFNTFGNLRSFSSGFSDYEAKKLILRDMESGLTIVPVKSLSDAPPIFLEGYYHKTSKNNDLKLYMGYRNGKRLLDVLVERT